jgi:3-hydroxypropanoate dehydrogenase
MSQPLVPAALDQLFLTARSIQTFTQTPVSDEVLRHLYQLTCCAPTGFNCQPARYVFVRSDAAKQRLAPALSSSNRPKMLGAPVTVIIGYDRRFFERVHQLFPGYDARPLFRGDAALATETAVRNSLLQSGFLIAAARALGLDAGPMSGFRADQIDRLFFPDSDVRTVLLVNLGHGDRTGLAPRRPRLAFDDVAAIV